MKKALAIALAVLFVLAFAVPAFAQSMYHTVKEEYVEAQIDIERQHGHLCNTGASLMYSVKGSAAEFMAERTITQVAGRITVSKDEAAWVAGATPLTVTSVIELCAPAKYEVTQTDWVYGEDAGWQSVSNSYIPTTLEGYTFGWQDSMSMQEWLYANAADDEEAADILAMTAAEVLAFMVAEGETNFTFNEYAALTEQLWAVQVQSAAGYSGNLEQTWEAAYGGYAGTTLAEDATHPAANKHQWAYQVDTSSSNNLTVSLGEDYVGNYFNIEQHARVSQGHLYRYIDISSPWSHAFVSEYAEVTGKADVQEAFAMGNLGPGSDVASDWWDLF